VDQQRKRELQHESLGRLREEIVAERAATLSRITRALEQRCSHVHALLAEIRADPEPPSDARRAAYETARRQAALWLWYLRVQREVNGLFDGDTLDERYPIPGPLREG
jgi:hypothetical protein